MRNHLRHLTDLRYKKKLHTVNALQATSGLAKWGRTEAVFHHLCYYCASYRADGILPGISS